MLYGKVDGLRGFQGFTYLYINQGDANNTFSEDVAFTALKIGSGLDDDDPDAQKGYTAVFAAGDLNNECAPSRFKRASAPPSAAHITASPNENRSGLIDVIVGREDDYALDEVYPPTLLLLVNQARTPIARAHPCSSPPGLARVCAGRWDVCHQQQLPRGP